MSLIDAVVFDLDGTLLDTLQDLADSANATLESLGHPTHPTDVYRGLIGGGIRELALKMLPEDHREDDEVTRCLKSLRVEYGSRWDATTRPYPGIPVMLDALVECGTPMAILSNKPHDFTILTAERLLDRWEFKEIRGVGEHTLPKPDPTGAVALAARLGVSPGRVLYVGDTSVDMDTASSAGMVSVGVTWGFRDIAELRAHGANHIIHEPVDLLELL
jgi:phosphoglycolate phosphatase